MDQTNFLKSRTTVLVAPKKDDEEEGKTTLCRIRQPSDKKHHRPGNTQKERKQHEEGKGSTGWCPAPLPSSIQEKRKRLEYSGKCFSARESRPGLYCAQTWSERKKEESL